ncbi:MAG: amidase domain-containing protein [Anaerolineaceae bacterium]
MASKAPQAETALDLELNKLEIERYHANVYQLRYVSYKYFLDYSGITIDPLAKTATALVTEGHDVVFEITDPLVSSMRNLEHEINLVKEDGEWKIVSDQYEDYLWRLLNTSEFTKGEMINRIDQSLQELENLDNSSPQQTKEEIPTPNSILGGGYYRDGAVAYAHQWAFDRNSAYYNFDAWDGDCTNFVSQAMHEGGGIPETASSYGQGALGWFYDNASNYAAAWTGVYPLYDFVINGHFWAGGPEGVISTAENLQVGDIIMYDLRDYPSEYDHSVIVVEMVDLGNGSLFPLIAAHSEDKDNYPFTAFNYYRTYSLHITGY